MGQGAQCGWVTGHGHEAVLQGRGLKEGVQAPYGMAEATVLGVLRGLLYCRVLMWETQMKGAQAGGKRWEASPPPVSLSVSCLGPGNSLLPYSPPPLTAHPSSLFALL